MLHISHYRCCQGCCLYLDFKKLTVQTKVENPTPAQFPSISILNNNCKTVLHSNTSCQIASTDAATSEGSSATCWPAIRPLRAPHHLRLFPVCLLSEIILQLHNGLGWCLSFKAFFCVCVLTCSVFDRSLLFLPVTQFSKIQADYLR